MSKTTVDMRVRSNVAFVTWLMEFSPAGLLTQVIVIEALRVYTDIILKDPEGFTKQMEETGMANMFHPPAWINACKYISRELKERGRK